MSRKFKTLKQDIAFQIAIDKYDIDTITGKIYNNGKEIGFTNKTGYRMITVYDAENKAKTNVQVHKLVYYKATGIVTHYNKRIVIHHLDDNPLNNSITNLVLTSQQCNSFRKVKLAHKNYKGVCYQKRTKKYMARIDVGGNVKYLGSFEQEIDAARAYDEAAKVLHGKFARLNGV